MGLVDECPVRHQFQGAVWRLVHDVRIQRVPVGIEVVFQDPLRGRNRKNSIFDHRVRFVLADGRIIACYWEVDTGVDFVAGGQTIFSVAPTSLNSTGALPAAQFSNTDGDGDVNNTLSGFLYRDFSGTITSAEFSFGGSVLDLQAAGINFGTTDASQELARDLFRVDSVQPVLGGFVGDAFVFAQGSPLETESFGRSSISSMLLLAADPSVEFDAEYSGDVMGATDNPFADPSKLSGPFKVLAQDYRALFFREERGRLVDMKPQMTASLISAYTSYLQQSESYVFDADEFKAYVAGNKLEAESLYYFQELGKLLDQIESLPVGPREKEAGKAQLLEEITPKGLTTKQFESAIRSQGISLGAEMSEEDPEDSEDSE